MTAAVQQIIVVLAVLLAATYVAWTGYARYRRRSEAGCGSGCNGCSSEKDKGFVALDQLRKR